MWKEKRCKASLIKEGKCKAFLIKNSVVTFTIHPEHRRDCSLQSQHNARDELMGSKKYNMSFLGNQSCTCS